MKLVVQIALGVFLALLLYEGFQRYQLRQDLDEATAALGKFSAAAALPPPLPNSSKPVAALVPGVSAAVDQAGKSIRWNFDNAPAMQRWKDRQRNDALRLKSDETCLGSVSGKPGTVVVRRVENGVPMATQLLENYRPVECIGDHRIETVSSQFRQR